MNEIPNLISLAIVHTIFCLVFILKKKNKALYDYVACLWLIFICLATVRRSLQIFYGDDADYWFLRIIFFPLTYGPCLYLYTRIQTRTEKYWKYKDLLHFIPFIFFTILSFIPGVSFASSKINSSGYNFSLILFESFAIISWISVAIYGYLAYRMIKSHSLNLLEKFSYLSIENTLSWVNRFSFVFLFVLSIQNIISIYSKFSEQKIVSGKVNGWLLLGFLYVLSFFFIRQGSVFSRSEDTNVSAKKEKYSKSGLNEDKIHNLASTLLLYMEKEKPYLNPDLVISDIAIALGINVNQLSQIINVKFQKNFFMFVNDYRVSEVIAKMKDSNYKDFPVLRIAFDAGFNSKSSFNSIFRKSTGFTPVEFRSKIN